MINNNETIELTLPVNSAYVSAIRLTASSIANRLKYSVDEIEDIKSAVSESCAFLIGRADREIHKNFTIQFIISPEKMDVHFTMPDMNMPPDISEDIALIMVSALMDSFSIENSGRGELVISISKERKTS